MSAEKTHSHMGEVVAATRVVASGIEPRRARNIILLLAVSMALVMTGYAIIMPLFARRLGDFGSGVSALSLMSTAYALAGIVASPFLGALADRLGRRPLVLGSLAAFALANVGFLLATSTEMLVVMRALEGAFSAGLIPAALGIVADTAPEDKRARWIGIVMGGASVGWVLGPVAGGVLYDVWGFEAPFVLSAGMGLLAFIAAAILIPETRPRKVRRREALRQRRAAALAGSLRAALPRSLSTFAVLLFIHFVMFFAWAFFQPQLMFYVFDDLGWTTIELGIVAGGYGLATTLGQTVLGQVSDRFGRKPSIIVGLILFSAQFGGLIFTGSVGLMTLACAVAGLGEGLASPALSAFFLDISEEQHQARVMGIRGSAGSLGGVVGPLLTTAVAGFMSPQSIFIGSVAIVLFGALLALIVLREPGRATGEAAAETLPGSDVRAMAAQASLRGVILNATTARKRKDAFKA